MPDSSGRFKGISVPAVPWLEKDDGERLGRYEYRDGVPYLASKPMTAREAFDESRPLPDTALYALGWTDEDIAHARRGGDHESD